MLRLIATAVALCATVLPAVAASDFPNKPIRPIVAPDGDRELMMWPTGMALGCPRSYHDGETRMHV